MLVEVRRSRHGLVAPISGLQPAKYAEFRSERFKAIKRFCCLLVLIGLLANGAAIARAAIILETATYGGSTSGGSALGSFSEILGARFVVSTTVAVDHIGGNIEEPNSGPSAAGLFGAIVKLANDPSAVPAPDWASNGSVQAATVFHASTPSTDILVPLSVVLVPGEYALMFGSGHFGATGNGDMPNNK